MGIKGHKREEREKLEEGYFLRFLSHRSVVTSNGVAKNMY